MKHLPNALTLLRLVLAPVVAWLMWSAYYAPRSSPGSLFSSIQEGVAEIANTVTLAFLLFFVAAITDLFDGMAARAFNAHSKFGRIIDPIADKALVGLPLIIIAVVSMNSTLLVEKFIVVASAATIVIRDVGMTAIRFLAPDGEGARVSSLAKWKTALELVVVGSFLIVQAVYFQMVANQAGIEFLGGLGPVLMVMFYTWIALLVAAAMLSAYTAYQYLRPKRVA
jgi:cardiolipin synthase (CMP-forming)